MRGVNYMVFSRESIAEIVEDYVKKNYGWEAVKVEKFQQRKIHNVEMFEVTLSAEKNEGNITDET